MSLSGGDRLGSYEVLGPLGAGGMGEVYRARDTTLNRDVALKVLPPTFAADADRLARFTREAQTLASLNHSNIAQIYAVDAGAIVMELVEGQDLSQLIARGPVPLDEAVPIARQIAAALEAAHEQGIVHRDLKPANIKVRADGMVKVLDFGLAKALDGAGGAGVERANSPTITSPARLRHGYGEAGTELGVILGTAAYMSPEQAKGRAVDRRADIWAWGCVLFEMLAGRPPFAGESVTDTLAKVIEREPEFGRLPSGTPPSVSRVIRHCLEKDPRKRVQHIGDARLALDDPTAEMSGPIAPQTGSFVLTRLLPWLIAAAALVVAAVSMWRGTSSPSSPGVLQLEIAYPPGMEGVSTTNPLAISPDGHSVAMIGNRQGIRTLVVRNIDELDARAVPSSVGTVNNVVFSPDGRSLGIVTTIGEVLESLPSENQVKTVSRGADLAAGLFWSNRGIVFGRDGALWTVPNGGGEARQLTTLDTLRGEVQHGAPFVLDDRLVLYSSFTGDGGAERIESVPLEGGPQAVVIDHASTPMVSPTGHLLFGRDGALMAAPFDATSARVTGAAFVVIPSGSIRVSSLGGLSVALSRSGSLARAGADFGQQHVMSVDRDGTAQRISVPPSTFLNPRTTRDGKRLLLEDRGTLIQSLDRARETLTPLAAATFGTTFVLWTRDERRVVTRIRNQPSWVAADGSGRIGTIEGTSANDWPSGAGPDSDTVLMTRVRPDTGADVFLISIGAAFEPRPLVQSRAFDGGATLSPDGRWLLYQSTESGTAEVYIRRYPALDRGWQVSTGGGVQARWQPSGKEIFYRIGEKMMGVSVDLSGAEPLLQRPAVLFEDPYSYGTGVSQPNYDVTPDGQFIMLRPVAGSSRVLVTLNWIEELKKILASRPSQR